MAVRFLHRHTFICLVYPRWHLIFCCTKNNGLFTTREIIVTYLRGQYSTGMKWQQNCLDPCILTISHRFTFFFSTPLLNITHRYYSPYLQFKKNLCLLTHTPLPSSPQAGISRSTWLGVTVQDENDWSPRWTQPTFRGHILETAAVNDPVLSLPFGTEDRNKDSGTMTSPPSHPRPLTVTATDEDIGANGQLRYSLAGRRSAARYFAVDPVTGEQTE